MIPHSRPTLDNKDFQAVLKTLKSGHISQEIKVEEFEDKLSKFIGLKGAIATNSGTAALHLALLALNVGEGDEVIMPSYVCSALLNAVSYTRATPKIVDINEDDFNISISAVAANINSRTKAIIVPHMFGLSADIEGLLDLRMPIIEDCAQSLGSCYRNKLTGSFGTLSIFSFYATKMMTTGEGGMVLSNSPEHIAALKDLRDYGGKRSYRIRYNYKMTDFQAALGISQLSKLPDFIKRRKEIASFYNKELSNYDIIRPHIPKDREHIYYRYVIRTKKNPNELRTNLMEKGITCGHGVLQPLHHLFGLNGKNFSCTEEACNSAISIPIYPSLKDYESEMIVSALKDVLAEN
jgi:dTDP-4-amino-4,6-dideoxygalactose transaminase